jgi:uncharacterized protein (DUF2141 family)
MASSMWMKNCHSQMRHFNPHKSHFLSTPFSRAVFVAGLLIVSRVVAQKASASRGTINADVVKLRNNHGQVVCTLFTPSDKFPNQSHRGMTQEAPIVDNHAICRFRNVPYGDYAIVAFQDEYGDGEFRQNWMGLPEEGYGFSDNPSAWKKPTFNDAKFTVDKPVVNLTINLNYWF